MKYIWEGVFKIGLKKDIYAWYKYQKNLGGLLKIVLIYEVLCSDFGLAKAGNKIDYYKIIIQLLWVM